MSEAMSPSYVVPNPALPKTIGWLNVVFGLIMVLGIPCCGGYLYLLSNLGTFMESQNKDLQARAEVRRKERLDELAKREATAESDEQKAALRAERRQIEAEPVPVIATANMDVMLGAFKDPRVMAHYATDFGTGMLVNLVMLVAGIGLLGLKEWGRKLSLWLAVIKIIRLVAITGSLILLVGPINAQFTRRAMVDMDVNAAAAEGKEVDRAEIERSAAEGSQGLAVMNTIYAIGFLIVGAIYPIASIWTLTRPAARAACVDRKPTVPGMPPAPDEPGTSAK